MNAHTIDEIMSMLDVEEMAKKFGIKHMSIRESFRLPVLVVKDYEQFSTILANYYEIHYFKRYGIEKELKLPEHWAYRYVRGLMDSIFQSEGGFEYAFNIARMGSHGGLKMLIDKIYLHFLHEDEEAYMDFVINKAMGLTWDGRVELMRQYLKKFAGSMPDGTSLKTPERLASNCNDIIRDHVRYVAQLKLKVGNYL